MLINVHKTLWKPFENVNCYLKAKYMYSAEDKCNLGLTCPKCWNGLPLLKVENLINNLTPAQNLYFFSHSILKQHNFYGFCDWKLEISSNLNVSLFERWRIYFQGLSEREVTKLLGGKMTPGRIWYAKKSDSLRLFRKNSIVLIRFNCTLLMQ